MNTAGRSTRTKRRGETGAEQSHSSSLILHRSSFVIGVFIIILAEVLLFSGNQLVGHWFTPIIWTGYVLLIDALVFKVSSRSLLATDRVELLVIVFASIVSWWLFEFYNSPRFWRS